MACRATARDTVDASGSTTRLGVGEDRTDLPIGARGDGRLVAEKDGLLSCPALRRQQRSGSPPPVIIRSIGWPETSKPEMRTASSTSAGSA